MAKSGATNSAWFSASVLPRIARARGIRLWDESGKAYIDGSGGPAVFCLGHAHPEVNAALAAQLDRIAHAYRYDFSSEPLERLAGIVAESCGGTLRHMVFSSGGSEAVESALKIALQYHSARGEPSRHRFISRQRSWHGNTLAALSLSGFAERRAPYERALPPVRMLRAVDAYRPMPGATAATLAEAAARELEDAILAEGPENVAGFIFEPVVGAAGGVVPAPEGYARRVREACDRHGVLMIADEVMCGAGRTGTWRALGHDGVEPDVMAIAKGLGGGYVPLGASVYTDRVSAPIEAAGGPMTGHTFTGHTLACTAAVAVQEIIRRDGLMARVSAGGVRLRQRLLAELAGLDAVGDVRGRGHFIGVEFVADRATREPFPRDRLLYQRLRRCTLEQGLICYPTGGNVDGMRGDTAILAPPYNATDAELDEIGALFARGARAALAEIGAA
jgi:adenosylmethionine-8-amino-7-oxononanoate aminotransferase